MTDNRKHPRHKVFKAGTIEFNRAGGVDCTVRNISQGGACLEVASPIGLPLVFDLHIPSDHTVRTCHLVWKTEKRIGVAFDTPSRMVSAAA
jgi:hypothetical protein